MSNDETKLYDEDSAVAEAGADSVQAGLDAVQDVRGRRLDIDAVSLPDRRQLSDR